MTLQATVAQDEANTGIDTEMWSERFAWVARIILLATLVAAPWMIGSVAYWAQFWIAAALLIATAFWWFETALNKRNVQVLPYVSFLVMFGILIGLIQLVPLSGGIGDMLLGRQVELYEAFGLSELESETPTVAKRISINTNGTWKQIQLLVLALSGLLLCCRYFRNSRDLTLFLATMTVNGVAISIFGTIQKLASDGQTLFWTIPLTVGGTPFGPYVNRNNGAGFLLICLACAVGLAYVVLSVKKQRGPVPIISKEIPFWRQVSQQLLYFVSELTAVKLATLIGMVFISLGIVASLSRGAVLALLTATICTFISYGAAKRPKNMGLILLPIAIAVIALTVWLGFSNDLVARFEKVDASAELTDWDGRLQTWTDTWPSVNEMGRLGSGLGTYENVSRLYRTDKEMSVFKYAENQYYQSLVEAGWIGLFVYLSAWGIGFYYAYFLLKIGQSPATVGAGLTGVFLLWGQAVASFLDFGLYIPANTLAMACTVGVVAYFAHSMAYRLKQETMLRFQFPNSFVQILLIVLFASCTAVCLDLNRKSRVENLKSHRILKRNDPGYEEVKEKINEITKLANQSPTTMSVNELGRLYIQRARLELYDFFKSDAVLTDSDAQQEDRIWDATSLVRLQERSERLKIQSKLSQQDFVGNSSIQANLPFAKYWFEASLRLSPLQPEVHVVLGEILAILVDIDAARPYLEQAIQLAPSNAILLKQVSVLYLQAGQFKDAAPHMKRYLALEPKDFSLLMQITTDQMLQLQNEIDHELIISEMIPDIAKLIYLYANDYAEPESLVQKTGLEKAEDLLEDMSQSNPIVVILRGKIKLAMGDFDAGIEYLNSALVNNPHDQDTRVILIGALQRVERYEEALKEAGYLTRSNENNRRYRRIYENIKSKVSDQIEN